MTNLTSNAPVEQKETQQAPPVDSRDSEIFEGVQGTVHDEVMRLFGGTQEPKRSPLLDQFNEELSKWPTWDIERNEDQITSIKGAVVKELLGKGNDGEVYSATFEGSAVDYAFKVVRIHQGKGAENKVRRIFQEGKIMASYNHPNIIKVNAAGKIPDPESPLGYALVFQMPVQTKKTLFDAQEQIQQGYEVEKFEFLLETLLPLTQALRQIATHGDVHMDIKPKNIFVDENGVPKIADFNLSLTGDQIDEYLKGHSYQGTPPFMAPEQITHKKVDARSDQYGLGASMYSLLTGKNAFFANSMASLVKEKRGLMESAEKNKMHQEYLRKQLEEVDTPREVIPVLLKMMEANPENRYSPQELPIALHNALMATKKRFEAANQPKKLDLLNKAIQVVKSFFKPKEKAIKPQEQPETDKIEQSIIEPGDVYYARLDNGTGRSFSTELKIKGHYSESLRKLGFKWYAIELTDRQKEEFTDYFGLEPGFLDAAFIDGHKIVLQDKEQQSLSFALQLGRRKKAK